MASEKRRRKFASHMTRANMFLSLKRTALIILSYQCITVDSVKHEGTDDYYNHNVHEPEDPCVISFPTVDRHFMPIPYQINMSGAVVVTPNQDGHLYVGHQYCFQFACSGSTFAAPAECAGETEVTVKCLKGNTFAYNGKEFGFDAFRCNATPKAKLVAADYPTCSGIANGLFNVGFDTRVPLSVYKVCFDARVRRTLYAWNYVNAPTFHSIQISKTVPRFVETEHFRSIDVVDAYNLHAQNESKLHEEMAENRILIKYKGHTLIPAQLLTRHQFVYSFQQFATYFYENTAPLWSVFSRSVWREVEKLFLRNLNKASGKHLIVTGTIDSTTRSNLSEPGVRKSFVLRPPDNIPVPHSIWTMVYNVRNKEGIVYVGLNSPLAAGNSTEHFCRKTPCPSSLGRQITSMDLVYCCSKESFEKAYGRLEPIVFKEF